MFEHARRRRPRIRHALLALAALWGGLCVGPTPLAAGDRNDTDKTHTAVVEILGRHAATLPADEAPAWPRGATAWPTAPLLSWSADGWRELEVPGGAPRAVDAPVPAGSVPTLVLAADLPATTLVDHDPAADARVVLAARSVGGAYDQRGAEVSFRAVDLRIVSPETRPSPNPATRTWRSTRRGRAASRWRSRC